MQLALLKSNTQIQSTRKRLKKVRTKNDLKKLERKMQNFKTLFPWFENYKLYGAIASFHINDDAKREALSRGFFVLQRSGDVIHTDAAKNLLVL
jgi:hypothetical protein